MKTLLKLKEQEDGDDELRVEAGSGGLWIEIEEPWAGDTVAGLGRECSFTLTKEKARELAAVLLQWADSVD